jgi:hypothetical protein
VDQKVSQLLVVTDFTEFTSWESTTGVDVQAAVAPRDWRGVLPAGDLWAACFVWPIEENEVIGRALDARVDTVVSLPVILNRSFREAALVKHHSAVHSSGNIADALGIPALTKAHPQYPQLSDFASRGECVAA